MNQTSPEILRSIEYLSNTSVKEIDPVMLSNFEKISYLHAIALRMGMCPKKLMTLDASQVYDLILQKVY